MAELLCESGIPPSISFNIQFPDGKVTQFHSSPQDTIDSVLTELQKIPERMPKDNQEMILLYRGRILKSSDKICELNLSEFSTIICSYKMKKSDVSNFKELRGFDRLARMGFSQADINTFRNQFHRNMGDNLNEESRLSLEDEWLPALILANGMLDDEDVQLEGQDTETQVQYPFNPDILFINLVMFSIGLVAGWYGFIISILFADRGNALYVLEILVGAIIREYLFKVF